MTKEYYQEHAEKIKQRARDWYYQNKDKNRQYKNQWRKKNRERYNQIQREYYKNSYQKNKDKIAERNKKSYQKKRQQKLKLKLIPFNNLAEQFEHVRYKDNYEVFENGMIWNWKKYIFMKFDENKNGYAYLKFDGIKSPINRIIALAFDDRDQIMLKDLHCHHCNLDKRINQISNLVFLPQNVHLYIHKHFEKETIKSIGEQVKHLRGSQKTIQFIRLVKKELKHIINSIDV